MQARRARLVADAGEVFDVFRLRQAFLQVARFVLALFEVQDGVLGFAEGAVEGLAVVGEVLLVAGFGFARASSFLCAFRKGRVILALMAPMGLCNSSSRRLALVPRFAPRVRSG